MASRSLKKGKMDDAVGEDKVEKCDQLFYVYVAQKHKSEGYTVNVT